MKIVLELDDADLRKSIGEQLSKVVAETTGQMIRSKVDEVLQAKFARVDDGLISKSLDIMAGEVLRRYVDVARDRHTNRNSLLDEALAKAARELLLKEAK